MKKKNKENDDDDDFNLYFSSITISGIVRTVRTTTYSNLNKYYYQ